MKAAIVADNHTVINVQGIRFVEKIDQGAYASSAERFRLRVTYKGDVMDYCYPDKASRDAQYDAIRIALGVPSQACLGRALEPAIATTASAAK